MSLRFLLDEDISYRVAEGLRRRGVDAVSVYEIDRGGRGIPDSSQLEYAASDGRALVTYNRADYQALDEALRVQDSRHAGILWCNERSIPRRAIGMLIQALESAAEIHESLDGMCIPLTRPSVAPS